jgi:hypothetical protein
MIWSKGIDMLWNRKPKEPPFDEAKWAYERDIRRCYGEPFVTLALCWVSHPVQFRRRGRTEDDAGAIFPGSEMGGILTQYGADRVLPCYVTFQKSDGDDGSIGQLTLFRVSLSHGFTKKKELRPEEQSLVLHVVLYDAAAKYREALDRSLRDAALSGLRFIHVVVGCDNLTEENLALAISDMRESDMRERKKGPTRRILELKVWQNLELQNSPISARRDRGIGKSPGIDGTWEDEISDRQSPLWRLFFRDY